MARLHSLLLTVAAFVSFATVAVIAQNIAVSVQEAPIPVKVLDAHNFTDSIVDSSVPWMVEFYTPWCGFCKKLAPIWEEFAIKAHAVKGGSLVNVAKLDCTEQNSRIATLHDVRSYPTIKYFRDNKVYIYAGARSVEAFMKFVKSGWKDHTPSSMPSPAGDSGADDIPDHVAVLTASNFTQSVSTGKWFVEFYAPWCGHCKKLAPEWKQLALNQKGKVNIAKIDAADSDNALIGIIYDVKGFPTLKYFRDGKVYDYEGDREVSDFETFIKSGWENATGSDLPSGFQTKALEQMYKVYQYLEPAAKLCHTYLGTTFCVLTLLSIFVGFLLGRITAPQRLVFISEAEYKRRLAEWERSKASNASTTNKDNKKEAKPKIAEVKKKDDSKKNK